MFILSIILHIILKGANNSWCIEFPKTVAKNIVVDV